MAKEPVVFYETDLVPQRKSHSLTRHRTSANRLAAFQKPGIYRELQQHWRSADPKQAKALERILTFFAVMLILTLVARGTAGATMATVTLASPGLGVITQSLRLDGAVRPAAQFRVECPADVPVAEILVNVGQNVQAGQPVRRFPHLRYNLRSLPCNMHRKIVTVFMPTKKPPTMKNAWRTAALNRRS